MALELYPCLNCGGSHGNGTKEELFCRHCKERAADGTMRAMGIYKIQRRYGGSIRIGQGYKTPRGEKVLIRGIRDTQPYGPKLTLDSGNYYAGGPPVWFAIDVQGTPNALSINGDYVTETEWADYDTLQDRYEDAAKAQQRDASGQDVGRIEGPGQTAREVDTPAHSEPANKGDETPKGEG